MTTKPGPLTDDMIAACVDDDRGPVALHVRQALLPVEGADAVFFPPTYTDIGYAIDTLADGRQVAQIDSVGAQANRLEPLFKAAKDGKAANPLAALVPQVEIVIGDAKETVVSILDAGHRLGDALVRASELAEAGRAAFLAYKSGDASAIAKLAPTTLVFGAWDSRDTEAKLPRIVQSVVRAWDVSELKRSAQYVPPVDYAALGVVSDTDRDEAEKNAKSPLAQRGYVHVPAVDMPGGIVARGGIFRDVTVNLVALRQLDAKGKGNGTALRRYVLGLALVAAAEPPDAFLRQGCLLTPDPDRPAPWMVVHRDGRRTEVALTPADALAFAERSAKAFGVGEGGRFAFEKGRAKSDVEAGKDKGKGKGKTAK
ncbi:MAG: type I-U CRISPR-associated protein Cas7 [Alphaproteobacteria bacterium]|nr:type I-U CRISPR-associated protein Cas7 [Alphaproteobacteria bacterium]